MATIALKGGISMESKKVSISSKRQITIPQKFFTLLGFNTEAECIMRGNSAYTYGRLENHCCSEDTKFFCFCPLIQPVFDPHFKRI